MTSEDMIQDLRGNKTDKKIFSKKALFVIIFLALLIIVPSGFYLFFKAENTVPMEAYVSNLKGSVLVQKEGKADTFPVEVDMKLYEKDRIITGVDGIVEIVFEDESHIRIGSDSRIDINKLHSLEESKSEIVELGLSSGIVWNKVNPLKDKNSRFDVRTPNALASVKGTQFFLKVDNNSDSLLRVYSGIVAVSSGEDNKRGDSQEIMVNAMEQAQSSESIPVPNSVVSIDVLTMEDFEKDNLVEDNPIKYIEIDSKIKTLLLEKTEGRINEIVRETEYLEKEQLFIEELLDLETDDEKIAELESIIDLINEELETYKALSDILEEEITELKEAQVILDLIKEMIEEGLKDLTSEELEDKIREEARNIRRNDKSKAEDLASRQEQIAEQENKIKESREKFNGLVKQLEIENQMQLIREGEKPEIEPDSDEDTDEETEEDAVEDDSYEEELAIAIDKDTATPSVTPVQRSVQPQPVVTVKQYSVNLGIATGHGSVSGGRLHTNGSTATIKATPAAGYTFVAWREGKFNISTKAEYSFKVNQNRNIEAVFAIKSYSVTFKDYDGSTIKTENVDYNENATAPANPERTGYSFTGWDRSFNNVTSNLTVTALYSVNKYTISFESAGGSAVAPITQDFGTAVIAPADPTREDYTFTGWDPEVPATMPDVNLTLTAQWFKTHHTVTFVDWDGTFIDDDMVEYDGDAIAPASPTREGYTFNGWDKGFSNITEDLTVTAQYIDSNLRAVVLEALAIEDEDGSYLIKPEDMENLNGILDGTGKGISDLTYLEYAVNLEFLWLDNNNISDLSPIQILTSLKGLYLEGNKIKDISSLQGLTALDHLYLNDNEIEDISSLQGLTNLYDLNITNNYIDLTDEDTMDIINQLKDAGVSVDYEPQKDIVLEEDPEEAPLEEENSEEIPSAEYSDEDTGEIDDEKEFELTLPESSDKSDTDYSGDIPTEQPGEIDIDLIEDDSLNNEDDLMDNDFSSEEDISKENIQDEYDDNDFDDDLDIDDNSDDESEEITENDLVETAETTEIHDDNDCNDDELDDLINDDDEDVELPVICSVD